MNVSELLEHAPLCFPPALIHFWVLTARRSFERSELGSTVPRKIDLYWFIPAFANKSVGSSYGIVDDDGQ